MFTRLSSKVFGQATKPIDALAKEEELATQSVSTEEPTDEAHSGSEESAGTDLQDNTPEAEVAADAEPFSQGAEERCILHIEECDGKSEADVNVQSLITAADDGGIVGGSHVRRGTAPSQTSDGQAERRARKRYREDGSGRWVKGRADNDGE